MPGMNLWLLHARDAEEPPFHFSNVYSFRIFAAKTAEEARALAAGTAGEHGNVWRDDTMTDCIALAPRDAGLIAEEIAVRHIAMVGETEDRATVAAAEREAAATAASKAEFARMEAVRARNDHAGVEAAEAAKKAAAEHAVDPAVSRAAGAEAAEKAAVSAQTPINEREVANRRTTSNPYVTKR